MLILHTSSPGKRWEFRLTGATGWQSAGRGRRIPDDRFRTSFGREHSFHAERGGGGDQPFQYGGYWFEYTDAWPDE